MMAAGVVTLADVIYPEQFAPYLQNLTAEKTNLLSSGAMVVDPLLDNFLAGEGMTINLRSYKDLDNEDENVSTDDPSVKSTPSKIGSLAETAIRLNRNKSWSSMDLAAALVSPDPIAAIGALVANYRRRRLQAMFIATASGVFASNAAAPVAGDPHTAGDFTYDVSGTEFKAGVTNFNAQNFIGATATWGDADEGQGVVLMHSVVYNTAKINQLIDLIPSAINPQAAALPSFLGRPVIVNDDMPSKAGVYETWIIGAGAFKFGSADPKHAVEVQRDPAAGNGSGQDILFNRWQWCIHPVGYAYRGAVVAGGAPNSALSDPASWVQVYPERKQIMLARLVTREHP